LSSNIFFSPIQPRDIDEFFKFRRLNGRPDECPICHCGIDPILILIGMNSDNVEVLFQCPKSNCGELFISKFKFEYLQKYPKITYYDYKKSVPVTPEEVNFEEEIHNLSPNFCTIYSQASYAEDIGLDQICGVGYRKALEYLIKDYIINLDSSKSDQIKRKPLANCIKDDISDENIKFCAEKAVWLGNDETHYVRKWNDKDIEDLKQLIDLTINFIKSEIIMQKYKESMSVGRK